MNWTEYFFSFSGRINRAKLWLFVLIIFLIEIAFFILFAGIFGMSVLLAGDKVGAPAMTGGPAVIAFFVVCAIVGIAIVVASIALTVKRLHDRNKGAAWLLVFWLLPIVLDVSAGATSPNSGQDSGGLSAAGVALMLASSAVSIWAFVELYCLRGTIGDNRFGPDPLADRT
jgi:uncharacterized membrane protein YhaH (DUF805 family)